MRQDHEPPTATQRWGWRYHHMGIPTNERREGERYLAQFKMYVSGFADSPYGIEWMRFEAGSPISELIRTVPHVAFEVDDLEDVLKGKQVLSPPSSPSAGVRVAMIIDSGCPIELIQFTKTEQAELSCVVHRNQTQIEENRFDSQVLHLRSSMYKL